MIVMAMTKLTGKSPVINADIFVNVNENIKPQLFPMVFSQVESIRVFDVIIGAKRAYIRVKSTHPVFLLKPIAAVRRISFPLFHRL